MRTIALMSAVCLAALSLPLLLGCPPGNNGGGGNEPPTANAGPNQSVAPGDTVTLNGTGTDPDGDSLTFRWTQTAGTNVTLNGADTATASFVAPAGPETLTFQLSVDDGTDTATDTVDVGVNTAVTQSPILYIAGYGGSNVVGYDISSPNNVNGNIAPSANLAGAQTLLSAPTDIVLDNNGDLLVTNDGNNSITTYADARDLSGINGNVAPTGNVQGAATTLASPFSLAFRGPSDLLFVAELNTSRILVFASASTSGFNGNLAPIRTITSADIANPIGINFGAGDTLYVANQGGTPRISVFDSASTLNGNVAATRVITSAAFGSTIDVFIDGADRMFVVDDGNRRVHVFSNASTLNGPVAPDVTLSIPGTGQLTAIAVDSGGIGYVVDFSNSAVYSYDNIATRNGTLPPDRTLQGANTQLLQPARVFLAE